MCYKLEIGCSQCDNKSLIKVYNVDGDDDRRCLTNERRYIHKVSQFIVSLVIHEGRGGEGRGWGKSRREGEERD